MMKTHKSMQILCRRHLRTYNDFYDHHLALSRRSILLSDCDKLEALNLLESRGFKDLRVRNILSFNGKISALAKCKNSDISNSILSDFRGSLKTITPTRDVKRRVNISLNSKNLRSIPRETVIFQHGSNLEDEIQVNHLVSCNQSTDLENRFFVYDQFVELSKLRVVKWSEGDYLGELFGNSMSGFGTKSSDIDILFTGSRSQDRRASILGLKKFSDQMKRQYEMFASCYDIFNATVPLVCFEHRYLPVNGDLVSGHVGSNEVLQSRLNFIYGRMNPLFPPVFTAIKQILSHMNVMTSYKPGYLTSFHVLIVYLHFLMTENLVPSVEFVLSQTQDEDLGNIDPKLFSRPTDHKMETLLRGFFNFVARLDFSNFKLDPISGQLKPRSFRDKGSLIVINPLDSDHNIAKSVSIPKLEELQRVSRQIDRSEPKKLSDFFTVQPGVTHEQGILEQIWQLDSPLSAEDRIATCKTEIMPSSR